MAYPVYTVYSGDVLPIFFDTFDGGTGASITMTGLAVTDIEIYKDGSATQRASDAGYTLLDTDGIDFDGITGIHGFSIDTGDNTDAGFYAVGSWYHVVVSSVTVDAQTVNFIAAAFRIVAAEAVAGVPVVDMKAILGTALTETSAGYLTAGFKKQYDVASPVFTSASINQTGDSYNDLKDGGRLDLIFDGIETHVHATDGHITADYGSIEKAAIDLLDDASGGLADIHTDIAAILTDTNELQADWTDGGRLDLLLDAVPTATANADALLKRDWTLVTGEAARSCLNAFRILRNARSVSGSTLSIKKEDDSTDAWTASVSTSASAETILGVDPS